jgi:putative FmdB family regulatory protein
MPMYEYRCHACGEDYEDLVRLGTPDEAVACPACGEHFSTRKLSTFATAQGSASRSSRSGPNCSGFS